MEKKRSKGIILFAISFILVCGYPLLTTKFSLKLSSLPRLDFAILSFRVIYGVIGIFTAVNILRLKEWSRRLITGLAIIGIMAAILFIPLELILIERYYAEVKENPKAIIEKFYDNLPEKTKTEWGMSKDEFIRMNTRKMSSKEYEYNFKNKMRIKTAVKATWSIPYMFLIFLFFTRPKIKEQFR